MSMMSSATRKKACNHSMHQPSASAENLSVGARPAAPPGVCVWAAKASATAMPRFSLPPGTLKSSICAKCKNKKEKKAG